MRAGSQQTWRDDLRAASRPVAAAMVSGFVAGVAVGGVGGRVAMLVLRLTSDSSLHGLKTDDGFTIGIVSTATIFLLLLTAIGGMLGGLLYLVVRAWLPPGTRPWLFAALTGVVGAALVIRTGGIDFTVLDPLPLAILMFIAIPAAYGIAMSLLGERLLDRQRELGGWTIWVGFAVLPLPLVLVARFGLLGVLFAAAVVGVGASLRVTRGIASVWRSKHVTWVGRAALATVGVFAGIDLIGDIAQIL
jgi:hypothetical protein